MNNYPTTRSQNQRIRASLVTNFKDIFKRPSGQYESIDGLRAISVYFVIVFHCFYFMLKILTNEQKFDFVSKVPSYLDWVWHGDKGVDIFFVISGFLVGGIIFREYQKRGSISIRNFYFRRIFRIVPVYIIALIFYMFVEPHRAKFFWANLLFINNFFPANWILAPHTWSITVEVQFYLIYPLIFLYLIKPSKSKALLMVFLFVFASIIRGLILLGEPDLYTTQFYEGFLALNGEQFRFAEALYENLYTRFGPLILGVFVAYLHIHQRKQIENLVKNSNLLCNMVFITGLILLISSAMIPYQDPNSYYSSNFMAEINLLLLSTNRNIFSLGVAIVLLFTLYPSSWADPVRRILSAHILLPIAKVSYSIYLFHPPIILLAAIIIHGLDAKLADITIPSILATSVLTLLLSWIFSVIVYITIEKPSIDYNKNRELRRAE